MTDIEKTDEKLPVPMGATPEVLINYAAEAATKLKELVDKHGWVAKFAGSEHLEYEAWQTLGKFYHMTVKTTVEYIEFGEVWGFKGVATVLDENGLEIGGAEAYCTNDEKNWANKPRYQLASMAQTRAGSKSLRQILGFVVVLAGYKPTPAEEMDGVVLDRSDPPSEAQVKLFLDLAKQKRGYDQDEAKLNACELFKVDKFSDITKAQMSELITKLFQYVPTAPKKTEIVEVEAVEEKHVVIDPKDKKANFNRLRKELEEKGVVTPKE